MASIVCTLCGAKLTLKNPVAPGKKVNCPKCKKIFVVEAEEESADKILDEEDVEETPPAKKSAKPMEDAEDEEDEESEAPSKGKKPAKSKTDPDEDEDDEKTAKSKKAEPAKKSGAMLLVGIAGVLLCCCGGTGGGIWYSWASLKAWVDGKTVEIAKGGGQKTDSGKGSKKAEPKPPIEIKTQIAGATTGLAISPDGKYAIVVGLRDGTKKNAEIWNLQTKTKLHDFAGAAAHQHGVAISPDGKTAAFSDLRGAVTRIDIESGKETELQIKKLPTVALASFLRFSPDSELLYFATPNRVISFDSAGKQRTVWNSPSSLESMTSFFADGKKVATGDSRGTIQVWEVGAPNPAKTISHKGNNPVNCAVSADGAWLISVTRMGRDLKVWDLGSGEKRDVNLTKPTPYQCSPLLTPDGKTLIYPTLNDYTILLVNVTTGRPDYELKGHTQEVSAIAVTADGSTLFSLGRDNALKIWDIKDLK